MLLVNVIIYMSLQLSSSMDGGLITCMLKKYGNGKDH